MSKSKSMNKYFESKNIQTMEQKAIVLSLVTREYIFRVARYARLHLIIFLEQRQNFKVIPLSLLSQLSRLKLKYITTLLEPFEDL